MNNNIADICSELQSSSIVLWYFFLSAAFGLPGLRLPGVQGIAIAFQQLGQKIGALYNQTVAKLSSIQLPKVPNPFGAVPMLPNPSGIQVRGPSGIDDVYNAERSGEQLSQIPNKNISPRVYKDKAQDQAAAAGK